MKRQKVFSYPHWLVDEITKHVANDQESQRKIGEIAKERGINFDFNSIDAIKAQLAELEIKLKGITLVTSL